MSKVSPDFKIYIDQDLTIELAGVFDSCRSYIDSLPSEVHHFALKNAGILTEMSPGRLSVLALPFWLGEAFGIDLVAQRLFSKANLFGLQHFTSQDNLIDETWDDAERSSLVILGTLCLEQMFDIYHGFFPSGSPFWQYVEKYWREWATSLIWERQAEIRSTFSEEDLLLAARKAAPLKICTTGIALLDNKPQLIPKLENAVDKMHMVMQMADDLADLEEDLAGNHYNTFLSMLEVKGNIDYSASKDIDRLGRILFTSGIEQDFFLRMQGIAEESQILLEELGLIEWAKLVPIIVQKARMLVHYHLENIVPHNLSSIFISTESADY
jgi:hypothetical protein